MGRPHPLRRHRNTNGHERGFLPVLSPPGCGTGRQAPTPRGMRCGMSKKTPSVRWERRCPAGGYNASTVKHPPPSSRRAFSRFPEPMLVRPPIKLTSASTAARARLQAAGGREEEMGVTPHPDPPALLISRYRGHSLRRRTECQGATGAGCNRFPLNNFKHF